MTKKEKNAVYELTREVCEKQVRTMMCVLFLAVSDELNIGSERMSRIMNRFIKYVDKYGEDQDALMEAVYRHSWGYMPKDNTDCTILPDALKN